MLKNVLAMGFLIGTLSIIFVTPYLYCKGIFSLLYGALSKKDKVVCMIPVYNMLKAERLYLGRISEVGIAVIFLIASIAIRIAAVFIYASNFTVQLITVIQFVISIVLFYFANVISVYRVLHDAGTVGFIGKTAFSLIFPLGQYYIGCYLPTIVKNTAGEEDTFK